MEQPDRLNGATGAGITVELKCRTVPVQELAFIGAASLYELYRMLADFADQSGQVDEIYSYNIRGYLRKRKGSVNAGIYETLRQEPNRFVAYNNGLTIVCDAVNATRGGLRLLNPSIVNGCQTTRTIYDFLRKLESEKSGPDAFEPYRQAFIALKILSVDSSQHPVLSGNITRYSNKQNAVRSKDFIALEERYRRLKHEFKERGYYLETQIGEYQNLSRAVRLRYPKASRMVNAYDATLACAAAWGKYHLVLDSGAAFTPGGREYEQLAADLSLEDLLLPWLVGHYATELGYGAARPKPGNAKAYRSQARYLFLYLYFRLLAQVLNKAGLPDGKTGVYKAIGRLLDPETPGGTEMFNRLMTMADEIARAHLASGDGQPRKDYLTLLKSDKLARLPDIIPPYSTLSYKLAGTGQELRRLLEKDLSYSLPG